MPVRRINIVLIDGFFPCIRYGFSKYATDFLLTDKCVGDYTNQLFPPFEIMLPLTMI